MEPIRYKDQSFQVTFKRDKVERFEGVGFELVVQTMCEINSGDLSLPHGSGISIQSPEDEDDPIVGMINSFKRALRDTISVSGEAKGVIYKAVMEGLKTTFGDTVAIPFDEDTVEERGWSTFEPFTVPILYDYAQGDKTKNDSLVETLVKSLRLLESAKGKK